MAQRPQTKQLKKRFKKDEFLSLEPVNYRILMVGLAIIALGYVAMTLGPWDGFSAITVSPILLILGYCVVIPIGIMYRRKKVSAGQDMEDTPAARSQQSAPVAH